MDAAYKEYKSNTRDEFLSTVKTKYGLIPYFCVLLGNYNYQVSNGGHFQYFDNGYASSNSRGFGGKYTNIDRHEELILLFKELDLENILTFGKKAYDVISSFDIDCVIDEDNEDDNYDRDNGYLNKLDDKWYDIDDEFMEQFNGYLKSLTLDNHSILELIEIAQTQKFNL